MAASLKEIELMADELNPKDQARLVAHLVPKLVGAVSEHVTDKATGDKAWEEYKRVRDLVAAAPSSGSMVEEISNMRR